MKVLYFHQYFSTPDGAAITRSYEMARRLLDRGHEVTMVCGSYAVANTGLDGPFVNGVRTGPVDGIDVIELDLPYSNSDSFLRRVWIFVLYSLRSVYYAVTQPADVVFATSTPLTAGIPGMAARWLRGRRFIFEVRDLWPELPKAMGVITNPVALKAISILEWASYRSAHRLIGLSSGIVDGIVRRGPDRERVALIPNGCDTDIFGPAAQPWRPDSIGDDQLMAIFAGTHGMANGVDAILDGAAVLRARGREDIKIVLVGSGKLKPALMARAAAENLTNVLFLDSIDKRRLAGLLRAADVGLQVLMNVREFQYGTSPNKFFDYLASGISVLTNYPGWVADLIGEYGLGWAVPPEAPEAFADALEAAASDRVELREKGRRARALAEEQFSRDLLGGAFVDWLEAEGPARAAPALGR